MIVHSCFFFFTFFFFNDTATTEIYTLSLHDALPICSSNSPGADPLRPQVLIKRPSFENFTTRPASCSFRRRSEEHTSELQSLAYLVCRLLLEKKKNITSTLLVSEGERIWRAQGNSLG